MKSLIFDNKSTRTLPVDNSGRTDSRQTPGVIFASVTPTPVIAPSLIAYSPDALELLGIEIGQDNVSQGAIEAEMELYFSGNSILSGSFPVAHCYCGHQFGSFAGQLGDGAAVSLGEVVNGRGERWELQLKGAGLTPYSRTADGRKVLRSSVREFLCSEAMHFLNVPTTRSASCITSQSTVQRDPFYDGNVLDEKCTVITRLAPNFFRVGSFEIFKASTDGRAGPSAGNEVLKKKLLDHVLSYYPTIAPEGLTITPGHYARFYEEVLRRTAELVARWQAVGFVHGVLNTDNLSVMGLTIDYGPFGFMEHFDPNYTPNGSDGSARYSYDNQPAMCRWNLLKLAEVLDPLLPLAQAKEILDRYEGVYEEFYMALMRAKLGLLSVRGGDDQLVKELFATMAATQADFTDTFVVLTDFASTTAIGAAPAAIGKGNVDEAPGPGNREDSEEACLDKLVARSATPGEMKQMQQRKMKVHQLGMHPQQIQQLWELIDKHPTQAAAMFGPDASMEALRNEIGGEKRKLDFQISAHQELERLESVSPKAKVHQDRVRWHGWLRKYFARLALDRTDADTNDQQRLQGMRDNNPTFILRNWIAQDAVAAAETGDYSKV